jgi:hypothetical protein
LFFPRLATAASKREREREGKREGEGERERGREREREIYTGAFARTACGLVGPHMRFRRARRQQCTAHWTAVPSALRLRRLF